MITAAELRVGVLGFAIDNDNFADSEFYYRQVEVRRPNHASTRTSVSRSRGRDEWSDAVPETGHITNIPYIAPIIQDAFVPLEAINTSKP
jgi:hypothetical protein